MGPQTLDRTFIVNNVHVTLARPRSWYTHMWFKCQIELSKLFIVGTIFDFIHETLSHVQRSY